MREIADYFNTDIKINTKDPEIQLYYSKYQLAEGSEYFKTLFNSNLKLVDTIDFGEYKPSDIIHLFKLLDNYAILGDFYKNI